MPLLSVRDLRKTYPLPGRGGLFRRSVLRAVDGVSFDVAAGSTLSLVGESGCGKSSTARCVVRIETPDTGEILLEGTDLAALDDSRLRPLRHRFQMVFQDPLASLNPRHRVRDILAEPLRIRGDSPTEVRSRVEGLAGQVQIRIDDLDRYPHQFSGGQRQRIGIARALALEPRMLVLDEPMSALDVSVQAQIMKLLQSLRDEMGLAFLLIAHDLAVVRHLSDRVGVMYLGRIVEIGPAAEVYSTALHPYTQALLSAAPIADPDVERARRRLVLQGEPPDPCKPPSGCRFRTRCWRATELCELQEPELSDHGGGHFVACHHPEPSTAQPSTRVRITERNRK